MRKVTVNKSNQAFLRSDHSHKVNPSLRLSPVELNMALQGYNMLPLQIVPFRVSREMVQKCLAYG